MDREKLFRHFEQRYVSKQDMISRIPLGTQPDVLWQELLDQRRSRSTVLPLYNYKGVPYWFVTTDKMVAASEKVLSALYESDTDFDPYTASLPVTTLEEVFYTSYVEGSQISIQDAMAFLTSDLPPRDIEEQLIANNRQAGNYASGDLFRPIDAGYLKELVYLLTNGMDLGGPDYRSTDEVDLAPTNREAFAFPSALAIPGRLDELSAFLGSKNAHPLIKAAVAQAYLLVLRPFPEGNERLGRMVSNIILLRAGYTFFSEISLSALISHRSYGYYEAMLNILREENGCDLTYFVEYFLDILSRAVEERQLRQRQNEDQVRQAEATLARTPLVSVSAPDPTPPERPQEPEVPAESTPPAEAVPNSTAKGGDNSDLVSGGPWSSADIAADTVPSTASVYNEIQHLADFGGDAMQIGAKFLLRLIGDGVYTFTVKDVAANCGLDMTQAGNFILRARRKGLIESTGRWVGHCMAYTLTSCKPAIVSNEHSPEILEAISLLRNSTRSSRHRRAGNALAACLSRGEIVTAESYKNGSDSARITTDMALPEQMGIVMRVADGIYKINRSIPEGSPQLRPYLKKILSDLFQSFGLEAFTGPEALAATGKKKSVIYTALQDLTMLKLVKRFGSNAFLHRLLVTPDDRPELFIEEDEAMPAAMPEDDDPAPEGEPDLSEGYSEVFLAQLDLLSRSVCSSRDIRVSKVLRSCLFRGTLLRSDYEVRGYTQNMWAADTALAAQLGLITKQPDGNFTINRDLQTRPYILKLYQKKTITAIYKTFGSDMFSVEMFVATMNYSHSYTYESLHRLSLLGILGQKTVDGGAYYTLLVDPEEHPECFIEAA